MELISREEAMEAIRAIKEVMLTNGEVINALFHVPTIESRPKGKWVSNSHGIKSRCSNCGATPITEIMEIKSNASLGVNWCANQKFSEVFRYCPTCGADMRGEE